MARNDIGRVMSKDYGQYGELCCICDRAIPHDKLVIHHRPTNNVICLICITNFAEVE